MSSKDKVPHSIIIPASSGAFFLLYVQFDEGKLHFAQHFPLSPCHFGKKNGKAGPFGVAARSLLNPV